MLITHSAFSDQGKVRTKNEDCIFADDLLGIYIVCDGMGGHAAGDLAAKTAIKSVTDELQIKLKGPVENLNYEQIASILKTAILNANGEIRKLVKNDSALSGMGTTITLCLISGKQAIMAHVGDSRLYLLRNKRLQQLSKDHTFYNDMVSKNLLSEEEAANSPYANMLMRAIGPLEAVEIDTLSFELLDNDRLLLCSDGLHACADLMRDEIRYVMQKDTEEAKSSAAKELITLANQKDGSDNISAVIIYVNAKEDETEQEGQRSQEVYLKIDTLLGLYLFNGLQAEEILKVIEIVEVADVPGGKHIIVEGDTSNTFFIILSGSVKIEKGGSLIATLGEKNHFGEMALLNQKARSATVTAIENTRLLCIKSDDFFRLIRQEHLLGMKIMWNIASELSRRLANSPAQVSSQRI